MLDVVTVGSLNVDLLITGSAPTDLDELTQWIGPSNVTINAAGSNGYATLAFAKLGLRTGVVSEEDLVAALAGQMHIKVVDLTAVTPHAAAVGLLPRDFIVRHRVLPMRILDDGGIELAMVNPLDVVAIDEIRLRTKRRVVPVSCTESGFDEAILIFTSKRGKLRESEEEGGAAPRGDELAGALDASIIEIVDSVISDAVGMKASDIHIEPREDVLQIRCRIDGVLHDLREYPIDLQAGILSRIKIMGNLDIA
ncbi:MAG: hypothetical protein HGB05_01190, partial [Chloroflexi bacterium]|nr:hypothetical protein [Chloroflexota bacterium]